MPRCASCGAVSPDDARQCARCGATIAPSGVFDVRPLIGVTVGGKFVLREFIGAGAMGTVYRADQITLGRTVAVKILNANLARDDIMVKRFHQEARAASRLNHPNTTSIIDCGQTGEGLLSLVREFVRGRTMTEVIRQDFPLPQARLVDIGCQVLAGLHEAHSQGVIHQDIKPDNILVERLRTGGDLVKIADFGIARLREEEPQRKDGAPVICGTPEYMAPEQIRGQPVDARSDVYSAGVLLYEIVTGERPFSGGQNEILRAHLTEAPKPPSARRREIAVSPHLEAAVMRSLAKDPAERYESAAEFRAELEASVSTVRQVGTACPSCSTALPAGSIFCSRCGVRLGDARAATAAAIDPRGLTVPRVGVSASQPTAQVLPDSRFPLPFVGRGTELALIERMLASRERARAMVVLGPPGIGKSRLCAEAAEHAAKGGFRVLTLLPDPTGLAAPWYPIRAAVSALLELPADVSRVALQSACQANGLDLANLPGLCELLALAAPVTGLELAVRRRECAASALHVLRGAPGRPATLLVFEDVDRCDRPSFDLLQRLVDYPGERPVHLLLTAAAGGSLELLQGAEILTLEGLDPDAAHEAVRRVLGTSPGAADLSARLHRDTAGAPLHIEQALRYALEAGGAAEGSGLADVIDGRIEGLPPAARHALQAASAFGMESPVSLIAGLLRADEDAQAALGTLVTRGLLQPRDERVVFVHPLLQEVVYAGIPVDARREFHARILDALSERGAPASVTGYHGYAAGGGELVLANQERAGLAAQQAFDDAGAMMHFQRAWELARWMVLRGEEDAEPAMARLGLVLGEAMRFAGDLVGAEGVLRETLERCGNNRVIAARVWRLLGHLAANGWQQIDRGREHMRTALGHALRSGDPALMAEIYMDLAGMLQRQGDNRAALEELQEGLLMVTAGEGPRAGQAPDLTWRMVVRLGELALAMGQAQTALGYAEAALFQAERVGSPVGAARSHVLLGDALAAQRRGSESARHRVKAVEWRRNVGDRRSTAELLRALADEDRAAGAPAQARARLEEARDLATAVEWKDGVEQSGATLSSLAGPGSSRPGS
ncbi:MAG: protein kinase [Deltaproteobacteria bacterium]|nr:protein kinase [Deltaproteobacteria bacterium]